MTDTTRTTNGTQATVHRVAGTVDYLGRPIFIGITWRGEGRSLARDWLASTEESSLDDAIAWCRSHGVESPEVR